MSFGEHLAEKYKREAEEYASVPKHPCKCGMEKTVCRCIKCFDFICDTCKVKFKGNLNNKIFIIWLCKKCMYNIHGEMDNSGLESETEVVPTRDTWFTKEV